jgi:hypothetical protein
MFSPLKHLRKLGLGAIAEYPSIFEDTLEIDVATRLCSEFSERGKIYHAMLILLAILILTLTWTEILRDIWFNDVVIW